MKDGATGLEIAIGGDRMKVRHLQHCANRLTAALQTDQNLLPGIMSRAWTIVAPSTPKCLARAVTLWYKRASFFLGNDLSCLKSAR